MTKILSSLEKSKDFWFLLISSFVFFLLRLPSFFEPIWYGDEGIYQVVGTALNHGKLLYKEIFDNKPPLLYWLYSFFQSDQFFIRLASAIFGILTIIMFFLLSKKLFANVKNSNKITFLTTFIFAILFGLPALEGNIANAENFMLLPIIASAFLMLSSQQSNPNRSPIHPLSFILNPYFSSGFLLGIAFLFKIVAVFDFAAFLVFYFILNFKALKTTQFFKISAGFFLPIFLVALFFVINGTFTDFVRAVFISNISYVGYANKIGVFPILLLVKLILLGIFLVYVFIKRKRFNESSLFILIWFAFSLFNSYFSQRPYTHYLLVLIPSLSLMLGLILFDKRNQKMTVVLFVIALLAIAKTFGVPNFNRSIRYYQNFSSYLIGGRTMAQYQGFFDRNTPSDYEIARFIKPKLSIHDTIFVWGNNAQLYQLTGTVAPTKYVVAYHILNYKDGSETIQKELEKTKPKFIVIMTNINPIPFPLINYSKKININNAAIYERIF